MHKHSLSIIVLSFFVILGKDFDLDIWCQLRRFVATLQLYLEADSKGFLQEEVFSSIIEANFFWVASPLTLSSL